MLQSGSKLPRVEATRKKKNLGFELNVFGSFLNYLTTYFQLHALCNIEWCDCISDEAGVA
jgi:hypothetical protein